MEDEYVVVAANGRVGGAVTVVAGLMAAARRAGEPLHLVASPPLVKQLDNLPGGVTVLSAPRSALRLIQARRVVRNLRPRSALLLDNLPLRSGFPEVVVVHNAHLTRPGWWRRDVRAIWLRIAARSAHTLVAPTHVLARHVQELTGHPRCVAVPHGVDLDVADRPPRAREGRSQRRILHVGLSSPQKNMPVLLDVLTHLPDDVRLAWTVDRSVGSGPALDARVRATGVADRIDWLGVVNRSDLVKVFASADVFVFPSDVESFGLPVAEALRCGVPVVVADRPWARELCGNAALYADPHVAWDLAAAVALVLDDPARAEWLSVAGRERSQRYDWDVALDRYLELLHAASVGG